MALLSVNISKIQLKDIMNKDIIKINSKAPSGEAAKIMLKNKIHGLPLVEPDNENKCVNIVTAFDLLGLTYYGRFSDDTDYINSTTVEKLAEDKNLISLPPDATIKQALDIIAEENIRTIPIIKNDELLGIVTILDIIRTILTTGETIKDNDIL